MAGKKEEPILYDKKDAADKIAKGQILARAILELVGKPKAHIEETLHNFIVQISKDENYKLIKYDIEKADKVEDSKDLYSIFAEIEFITKDMSLLMNFCVDYMPSSVEVLEPAKKTEDAAYFSNMMTEFVGRLHAFDMEFKKLRQQERILSQSLNIMIQNSILIYLSRGPRTLEQISEATGIKEDQAKLYLDKVEKDEKIKKDGDKYSIVK